MYHDRLCQIHGQIQQNNWNIVPKTFESLSMRNSRSNQKFVFKILTLRLAGRKS